MTSLLKMPNHNADNYDSGYAPSSTPLEERFRSAEVRLNHSRKKLIRAILENPDDTFFLSSRELAKRYSVDAATIVRTIQALGYEKYADFAADLRSHFITRITPYTVLKAASREKRSLANRIQHSVEMDVRNLHDLHSSLDTEKIIAVARRINRARRILVVGIDLAATLSWQHAYGLTALGLAAEAPVGSAGNVQRRVRTLTRQDMLIAISFGRCLRETVEAAQRAKMQGVPTLGITDGAQTPKTTVPGERFSNPRVFRIAAAVRYNEEYPASRSEFLLALFWIWWFPMAWLSVLLWVLVKSGRKTRAAMIKAGVSERPIP
jgi:DNA-binding MurR/RpiR family transcriptional regulator